MDPNLVIEFIEPQLDKQYQTITFAGEFDKAGYNEISARLNEFVKAFGLKILIFDFGNLKFINSEGIGYLIELNTYLIKHDKQLVIVAPNAHVKDVFLTIGLRDIIPIKDSLRELTDNL